MEILNIVKILIAVATIGFGAIAVFRPDGITGFTGMQAANPRGTTEIRAAFGGAFVSVAVGALIFGTYEAYGVLGVTYAGIALIRLVSMFVDDSVDQSNLISLGSEVLFAVLLLLP